MSLKNRVGIILAVVGCVGAGAVAPARAALPPLHCVFINRGNEKDAIAVEFFEYMQGDTGLCVANDNTYQWAGLRVTGEIKTRGNAQVHLELSFFDFDQFPRGGSIPLVSSTPFQDVFVTGAPQNVETGRIAWWHAGVFCARLVNDSNGYWRDVMCVDTNGVER